MNISKSLGQSTVGQSTSFTTGNRTKYTKNKRDKIEQWNNAMSSADVLNFINGHGGPLVSSKKQLTINNQNLVSNKFEDSPDERLKDERDGCRSLLCDASGIVFAEMIYRCTVCSAVHEFIGDAKQHYHRKHMNNDYPLTTSLNNLNNLVSNASSPFENMFDESTQYDESISNNNLNLDTDQLEEREKLIGGLIDTIRGFGKFPNFNNDLTGNGNNLSSSKQPNQNSKINFASNTNNGNNLTTNANTNVNNQNLALYLNNLNLYKKDFLMMNENVNYLDEGFYSNNSSLVTNYDSTPTYRATESCTRSGFITCPVCSSHRFYTTLQRRYGQFTCVACYRFFKEFFINPQVYSCTTLSNCSLNVKQKCKACWIHACMRVYTVDNKRKSVLEMYKPLNSSMEFNNFKTSNLNQFPIITNNQTENDKNSKLITNEDNEESASLNTSNNSLISTSFLKKFVELNQSENCNNNPNHLNQVESMNSFNNLSNLKSINSINNINKINTSNNSLKNDNSYPLDFTKKNLPTCKENVNLLEHDTHSENGDVVNEKNGEEQIQSDESNDLTLVKDNKLKIEEDGLNLKDEDNEYTSKNFGLIQMNELTDWNNNSLPKEVDNNSSKKRSREATSLNVKKTKTRVKNWSCLKCDNCLADDCGKCINCLDRPKFGGKFIRKQRCVKKKCLMKIFTP